MTRALQRHVGDDVRVRVLREGTGTLLPDEVRALGSARQIGHVREVALQTDGRAWMVARTVYFRRTHGARHALSSLGTRPLGELLFAGGAPRWSLRECATLSAHAPLFALIRRAGGRVRPPCWARRTVFLFHGQRLLVTEIFLPAMFREPRR
jgi:chorismate--pyruvate lyase